MMPDQQAVFADIEAVLADFTYMTARWGELNEPAYIEVRCFKENAKPQVAKFKSEDLEDAASWTVDMNNLGFNTYSVRNPVRASCSGSAEDTDIIASFFLWADCDEGDSANNIKQWSGPKYSAAVLTGTIPSTRVHLYWQLENPVTDLSDWKAVQQNIAAHFDSDKSVVNPSRIMRIGGTVAYPKAQKQAKGYIKELSVLRTIYPEHRHPVTIDQMRRAFSTTTPVTPTPQVSGFPIDTGMDGKTAEQSQTHYADILRRAQTDGEKHTGVRDLAAHLAGSSVTRVMAEAIIRNVCPIWDEGVEKLIDTAYAKFYEPAPVKSFDHPSATDPDAGPSWTLQSAANFTADFVAPEYLIDGVIQRGRLYTLTAPTGSGKTAVMLYAADAMASGKDVCGRETEGGDVIYMAGENPDDVRGRIIATLEKSGTPAAQSRMHFIAGTFSIRQDMKLIHAALEALPNCNLVIIDTLAAYFDGDDTNSNADMLDFARVLRKISEGPGKPAVIVPAHPVKNAAKNNLTPMGGSAFLNEVDGNLCLWKRDAAVELHWQGKHRGPDFEPLMFEIEGVTSELIKDAKGRLMPTVLAKPLLEVRALEIATKSHTIKERIILSIENSASLSISQRCVDVGLISATGNAQKSTMMRRIMNLKDEGLVKQILNNWYLSDKGKAAVEIIENGGTPVEQVEE